MPKKYQVLTNAIIAKAGTLEKTVTLDLESHGLRHVNGADDVFKFIVAYNKSEATSSITITYAVSFDGLLWQPAATCTVAAAFAGATGTPNFQDVTGVTVVRGWDVGVVAHIPLKIKLTIVEADAGAISDIDLVLIGY